MATIPDNLLGIQVDDPLGLDVGDVTSLETASEELEVDSSTFTALQAGFTGIAAAFAYLLFVLLYTPCVAAMGALVGEFGGRWAAFAGVWTFALAYGVATIFYQVATFSAHPLSSSLWIGFFLSALVIFYLWLKVKAKRTEMQTLNVKIITE